MAKIRLYLDRISASHRARYAIAFAMLCAVGLSQQATERLVTTASLALALTTPPGPGTGTARLT